MMRLVGGTAATRRLTGARKKIVLPIARPQEKAASLHTLSDALAHPSFDPTEGTARFSANVPKDLFLTAKAKAVLEGLTLTDLALLFLWEYVDQR